MEDINYRFKTEITEEDLKKVTRCFWCGSDDITEIFPKYVVCNRCHFHSIGGERFWYLERDLINDPNLKITKELVKQTYEKVKKMYYPEENVNSGSHYYYLGKIIELVDKIDEGKSLSLREG